MIVQEVHGCAHLGIDWVFFKLREKYWIIQVTPLIRKVKHNCVVCRRLYASNMAQKMASLPVDRCIPFDPAFTVAGVDLFGPFWVTMGRARVERYACLFSCFRSRAIHIEKMDDFSADVLLNGLVRFVSRRGQKKHVYCDNGTNMVGALNELSPAFRQLDRAGFVRDARRREIEWTLIHHMLDTKVACGSA